MIAAAADYFGAFRGEREGRIQSLRTDKSRPRLFEEFVFPLYLSRFIFLSLSGVLEYWYAAYRQHPVYLDCNCFLAFTVPPVP